MKRSSRPPVLEPRPSPRRRALSEEERALWDAVAKQVKPLRKLRVAKAHAAPPAGPSLVAPATRLSPPSRAGAPAPPPPPAPPPRPRRPPPLTKTTSAPSSTA